MQLFRSPIVRLLIGAVLVSVIVVGWQVTSAQRTWARADAMKTVEWFYNDARFSSFPAFVYSSKDYLDEHERAQGEHLKQAFGQLERRDFCNDFPDHGILCPDELMFNIEHIAEESNDGFTARVLVKGYVLPQALERGKTKFAFATNTYEPFAHSVILQKEGENWFIIEVIPDTAVFDADS